VVRFGADACRFVPMRADAVDAVISHTGPYRQSVIVCAQSEQFEIRYAYAYDTMEEFDVDSKAEYSALSRAPSRRRKPP